LFHRRDRDSSDQIQSEHGGKKGGVEKLFRWIGVNMSSQHLEASEEVKLYLCSKHEDIIFPKRPDELRSYPYPHTKHGPSRTDEGYVQNTESIADWMPTDFGQTHDVNERNVNGKRG
jgi:hypothetical protein